MATLATDDFNRANGGLGANWTTQTGHTAFTIVTNQCVAPGPSNFSSARYSGTTWPNDQWAQHTVISHGTTNTDGGPAVRVSTSGAQTFYFADINDADSASLGSSMSCSIHKCNAGTFTTVGSASSFTVSANDVIYLEVQGTSLVFKQNGTTKISATDSGITSGAAGIAYWAGASNAATIDSWSGGDFGGSVLSITSTGAASWVGKSLANSALSAAGVGALSGVGRSLANAVLSASGVGAFSGVGQAIVAAALSASGTGTLTGVGAALANAILAASGLGTLAGVGASNAAASASSSGVGSASFASSSSTTFDVTVVSRRYGREKKHFPLPSNRRKRKVKSFLVDPIANAVMSASGTSTASFVGAGSAVGLDVFILSRRYARRKARLSEKRFLFLRHQARETTVYGTVALSPNVVTYRDSKKRRPDPMRFLTKPHRRRKDYYYTRFSSTNAALSAAGTSTVTFASAALMSGAGGMSGVGAANFTSTAIAAGVLSSAGVSGATFASTDVVAGNEIQVFGRRKMVKQ